MKQSQRNTADRLEVDIREAVYAMVGKRLKFGDQTAMTHVACEAERIAESVVFRLRRNWTVTERARGERKVPNA